MCESTAYLCKEDGLEKIMENVVYMKPENGKVYLVRFAWRSKNCRW